MASEQQTVDGTKTFIPLENNPVVFSHLIHELGVSPKLVFHDVYTIDEPELLNLIPRPVFALIFICPGSTYWRARGEEAAQMEEYTGVGEEPVMWFKQTIREACGTMALLHAVCNGAAKDYIQPGSHLDKMRREAIPLKTKERAEVLYNSEGLEKAHSAAAQLGDTSAPPLGVNVDGHFICFVKGNDGHLWELNGGMKGPVDRGALQPEDDALSENAVRLGVRTIMEKAGADINFSLVALALNDGV